MYVNMLPEKRLLLDFNNTGVPRWEDRFMRAAFRLVTPVVKRRLAITPGVEVSDEADIWRELDWIAELLADGRPYLGGERFGAADLTFGALSAPLVVPSDYGTPLPGLDGMPRGRTRLRHPRARAPRRAVRAVTRRASPARDDQRRDRLGALERRQVIRPRDALAASRAAPRRPAGARSR